LCSTKRHALELQSKPRAIITSESPGGPATTSATTDTIFKIPHPINGIGQEFETPKPAAGRSGNIERSLTQPSPIGRGRFSTILPAFARKSSRKNLGFLSED
jgi:hypothetical protein